MQLFPCFRIKNWNPGKEVSMPIFEFVCKDCNQLFEQLIFNAHLEGVTCPSCGSLQVRKKMSTFSSKSGGDGSSFSLGASSASSCSTGSV